MKDKEVTLNWKSMRHKNYFLKGETYLKPWGRINSLSVYVLGKINFTPQNKELITNWKWELMALLKVVSFLVLARI